MERISFSTLTEDDCGFVFLGCGGDLQEWIDGIPASMLDTLKTNQEINENIMDDDIRKLFDGPWLLTTTGGRKDLVFPFKNDNPEMGHILSYLCLWRLRFGDCSWISDYRQNYPDQHAWEQKSFVTRTSYDGKRFFHEAEPTKDLGVVGGVVGGVGEDVGGVVGGVVGDVKTSKVATGLPKVGKKTKKRTCVQQLRVQPLRKCKK